MRLSAYNQLMTIRTACHKADQLPCLSDLSLKGAHSRLVCLGGVMPGDTAGQLLRDHLGECAAHHQQGVRDSPPLRLNAVQGCVAAVG